MLCSGRDGRNSERNIFTGQKDDPVVELWRSKFLKEAHAAFDDLAKGLFLMGMEVDTGAEAENQWGMQ